MSITTTRIVKKQQVQQHRRRMMSSSFVVASILSIVLSNYYNHHGIHAWTATTSTTTTVFSKSTSSATKYSCSNRINQHVNQHNNHRLYMSEPSDTSSEDFTNDDYPGYAAGSSSTTTTTKEDESTNSSSTTSSTSTANNHYVGNVLELLPTSILSSDVNEEVRSAINEAIVQLERMGDDEGLGYALSPLLNGVWELKYYGGFTSDGSSKLSSSISRQLALFLYSGGSGMFAYQAAMSILPKDNPLVQLGPLEISISRVQPRIEATVPINILNGSSNSYVRITAQLDVKSNIRLRETYESINIIGLTNIPIPNFLQYSRDIYITYVDNDILIIRDGTGVPEILIRKDKIFTKTWGTDPIDSDDMIPPGVPPPDIIIVEEDDDDSPSY